MWPRVIEIILGIWLLASPMIFSHPQSNWHWWATDLICGLLAVALASASFFQPTRKAFLGQFAIAIWLGCFGYFGGGIENPPALQNDILVALFLLMFAVVPNEASKPPLSWRLFLDREAAGHAPSN